MPARTATHAHAPQPERHGLAADELRVVDDEDARVVGLRVERRPRALEQRARRPAASVPRPAQRPRPGAGSRGHDEVAALGDHAREHALADERRARRDHAPRRAPVSRLEAASASPSPIAPSAVLADERLGVPAEVGRDRRRRPRPGAAGRPSSDARTTIVPMSSGMPTSANSKNPNGRPPCLGGRVGDDHVHGRAGQREHASPRGRRTRAASAAATAAPVRVGRRSRRRAAAAPRPRR